VPEVTSDATNSYIYGPGGLPIEQIDHAEAATYYFHDALGSTRALLGSGGGLTASGDVLIGAREQSPEGTDVGNSLRPLPVLIESRTAFFASARNREIAGARAPGASAAGIITLQ
jgi:hypothetical protein